MRTIPARTVLPTAGPSAAAIEVRGLRKAFGDTVVLDGIDLTVAGPTIFALLGPNGAGKTTMVRILSTLISADAGVIRVAGHDLGKEPDAVRAVIGVTGQFSAVDGLLTGEENLRLMADLHHLGRTEGRRRTMAISRSALLTAHVVGSMIQAALCVAVTIGVALLAGYRSGAGPFGWLAAIGVLALFAFALIWLTVALGLAAKSVETASNSPMFLTLLPFLGSGFVPTRSMPVGLRQFAEYQPFTPVTETVRGLLMGTPIGNDGIIAAAWCAAIALAGYLWARKLYTRDPAR